MPSNPSIGLVSWYGSSMIPGYSLFLSRDSPGGNCFGPAGDALFFFFFYFIWREKKFSQALSFPPSPASKNHFPLRSIHYRSTSTAPAGMTDRNRKDKPRHRFPSRGVHDAQSADRNQVPLLQNVRGVPVFSFFSRSAVLRCSGLLESHAGHVASFGGFLGLVGWSTATGLALTPDLSEGLKEGAF